MRPLLLVALAALPFSVHAAESTSAPTGATGLTLSWTHPTEADGGRLACTSYGNGCVPLNRAACDAGDDRPLEVLIGRASGINVLAGSNLYIWLVEGTSACTFETEVPQGVDDIAQELEGADPLVTAENFVFPDSLNQETPYDSTAGLLTATGACEGDGVDDTFYRICFGIDLKGLDGSVDNKVTTSEPNGYIQFLVDTVAPAAPTGVAIEARDGRLLVTPTLDSKTNDIDTWRIRYRVAADVSVEAESCDTWSDDSYSEREVDQLGDTTTPTLELDVANGNTYEICVAARDYAGNTGPDSTVVRGTPRDECDFYECYPGTLEGGYCGATRGALWPLVLLLVGLAWRRRPRATLVTLSLALVLLPSAARANPDALPTWGMELRFGPYQPAVAPAGAERDYYELVYASDSGDESLFAHRPLMKAIEVDYYLDTRFGLAGITLRAGHWRVTGPTRICDTGDPANTSCTPDTVASSMPGNDETALTVVPLGAGLIYRFDGLKRLASVPLVAYGKAGLDYYFWWNAVGGKVSQRDGKSAQGGTFGVNGALGVSLNLDFLDPATALSGRATSGIADTYLFFEYSWLRADDRGGKLFDMSAELATVGLSMDFL